MKYKKIFFLGAFVFAISSSIAFTAKSQGPSDGYYTNPSGVPHCVYGELDQNDCAAANTGNACTITTVQYGPLTAYANETPGGGLCVDVLRQPHF